MDMTEHENVIKNLKELFWAANSAFLENHVILLNRVYYGRVATFTR